MPKDLLGDFQALYEEKHEVSYDDEWQQLIENEHPFKKQQLPRDLDDYLKKVTNLHQRMELLKTLISELQKKQSQILTATAPEKLLSEEHDQLLATIKETSTYLNNDIQGLKKKIENRLNNNRFTTKDKIQRDQINILVILFQDVMHDYNQVQLLHRDKCKSKIKRQFHLVDQEVENEKIEEMLEKGNFSAVFHHDIIFADIDKANKSLQVIEERQADILKLEQSIKDLFDIFQEIAFLVEAQGDMIENIQHNVEETKFHVEETKTQLKAAIKYKRQTIFSFCCPVFLRKSMCCTIL